MKNQPCLHYGQAFHLSRFYKTAMALRIRELREKRQWTQDVLASKSGMSRSQLAMIEKESRPANTLRLNAIATALGVRMDELFAGDGSDQDLLSLLRTLDPEDRAALVRMAEALASKHKSS